MQPHASSRSSRKSERVIACLRRRHGDYCLVVHLRAVRNASWALPMIGLRRSRGRSESASLDELAYFDELRATRLPNQGRRRVGIEIRFASRGPAGGIVVVLVGTLHELFRQRPDIDFVVFCTVFNRELLAIDALNVETITLPLDDYFMELDRLAHSYDFDVLFRSYPTVDVIDFPLDQQIFLVPDLQHEYYPEFFESWSLCARRSSFKVALDGAGAIMTISEFARRTIEERAGPDRDVFVAQPSVPPDFLATRSDDTTEGERATVPAGEFFLFPANLWPHKNHERLFQGFRRFRERTGSPAELVLTGSQSGWDELRARYLDLPIRHLGYVSPPLLRLLYERALALTFFSQYEGFGIPLLEAFEVGTPVVCSNATSLPEVAGDAALMCDPKDVTQISRLLERIAGDAELRAQLTARGRLRLPQFSWASAAKQLDSAIERIRERTEAPALELVPLVSIVTPSYNQGRFIRATIESVLAQTYANIEYLVVDGASADDTIDILRSYGGRISWISEPDSGQAEAINKGLRMMHGQIVGYLNSDDVLLPDAIGRIVEHFRVHPECDLVYADAQYIDDADRVIGMYRTAEYSFRRLMEDCCICQPAAYWRSHVATRVGLFDERLQYAMDYDYWIRLDRAGCLIQYMPKTIAQSRLHAGAKTLRARREIYYEIFRVCRVRGGYISRNYVYGLWSHIAYEERGITRVLRHLPLLRALLVLLHHAWLNRSRCRDRYRGKHDIGAMRLAARWRLIRRLRRMPRLLAYVVRTRVRLQAAQIRAPLRAAQSIIASRNARLRVTGFWHDNWVAERLDVVVYPRAHDCNLRIVGRAVARMTLRVSANKVHLGEFNLRQGERESVTVQLPAGPRELVTFAFSDHAVDANGRRVAFLLEETNVFREEDLYTLALE